MLSADFFFTIFDGFACLKIRLDGKLSLLAFFSFHLKNLVFVTLIPKIFCFFSIYFCETNFRLFRLLCLIRLLVRYKILVFYSSWILFQALVYLLYCELILAPEKNTEIVNIVRHEKRGSWKPQLTPVDS